MYFWSGISTKVCNKFPLFFMYTLTHPMPIYRNACDNRTV